MKMGLFRKRWYPLIKLLCRPTIVWDFNGTLLNDVQACLNALNTLLKMRHLRPITLSYYRENFGFPVIQFYEHLGMIPSDAEDWAVIGETFHMRYLFSKTLQLQPGALEMVTLLHQKGYRQGVLSALEQGLLELQLAQFGLANKMDFVLGSRSYDGASKLEAAATLNLKEPVILIGDTAHDAEVAKKQGWECILCSAGHQTKQRLKACGFPVVERLDALASMIIDRG